MTVSSKTQQGIAVGFPAIRFGDPALVLAPMEGVTDAPMRALLTERGGFRFCVSEFLRVSQEALPARAFQAHVPELIAPGEGGCRTPSGTPVQIQLLGGNAERLSLSARNAVDAGARAVDLNFGCPAQTVNRHDGGGTLLKYPERIREIVSAVRNAVPRSIPVSAKLRLGWDTVESIHENARMAEEGGASWITIHARTRVQGYAPPVDWSKIGEVRRELSVPVVANGDIWTIEDFRVCRQLTGCEHFMLGRGAVADPSLAGRIALELGCSLEGQGGDIESFSPLCARAWLPLVERFAELGTAYAGQKNGYVTRRVKQWVRMASARHPMEWLDPLKRAENMDGILAVLRGS